MRSTTRVDAGGGDFLAVMANSKSGVALPIIAGLRCGGAIGTVVPLYQKGRSDADDNDQCACCAACSERKLSLGRAARACVSAVHGARRARMGAGMGSAG